MGSITVEEINNLISAAQESEGLDTSEVSDGYHTFEELYEHRNLLFLQLARFFGEDVWKAKRNHDGSKWEGWFILGINPRKGHQVTYHLPIKYWDQIDCETYDINPFYDGHTSKDVLERIKNL